MAVKNMTKNELKAAIKSQMESKDGVDSVSLSQVERFLESFETVLTESVGNGLAFELSGVFKVEPSVRAARSGRNPKTGADIEIEAKYIPKFKALKKLKDVTDNLKV